MLYGERPDKLERVTEYLEGIVALAEASAEYWQTLRGEEPDGLLPEELLPDSGLGAEIMMESCEAYRELCRRRLEAAELIRRADMSLRHKQVMRWRYVDCKKWREIARKLERTERMVYLMRREGLRALARAYADARPGEPA